MPKRARVDVTSQPHDAILKYTFSQPEHAAGLLKAALAPEVVALIEWTTLKLEKIDFVDRGLRSRHADLLFSARMGDEQLYVHALIEQQRKVESLMIFRFGVYMMRHWERLLRDRPTLTRLPPIVPILIHHSDTGWTAATAFEDIIATGDPARAALLPHIPRFQMRLCDVSAGRPSGLVKQALTNLGRVVLWSLSVAHDDERLKKEIVQVTEELNAMFATLDTLDAVLAVLRYLVATHVGLGVRRVANLLATTARKGQNLITMDVLDELKREGRDEGREEGRDEGRREVLLELLAARFGPVPAAAKAQILAASASTLTRWSLRVLSAPTLAAVLRGTATKAAKKAAPSRRPATRKQARAS